MPLNTVMPIDLRALAPAPVATTSGATPRMKANDVIRIGRRRSRAASTAASRIALPSISRLSRAMVKPSVFAVFPLMTSPSSCDRRFFNLCGNYITELDDRDDTVRVYATRQPLPPMIGALTWVTLRKPQ